MKPKFLDSLTFLHIKFFVKKTVKFLSYCRLFNCFIFFSCFYPDLLIPKNSDYAITVPFVIFEVADFVVSIPSTRVDASFV